MPNSERNHSSLWLALLLLVLISPFANTFVNSLVVKVLSTTSANYRWVGQACIPSAILFCALYLVTRPAEPFGLPSKATQWKYVWLISIGWLLAWLYGSIVHAFLKGGWHAYTVGVAPLVGFLFIGALGEELFFRGALFEVGERLFGPNSLVTLLGSSVLFSLHHFQLHGYQLTEASLLQVAYTLPMGLVFGKLRLLTKSIWPGLLLHIVTNLFHSFSL